MQPEQAANRVAEIVVQMVDGVEADLPSRSTRAAVVVTNAAKEVLRGQRSGRRYKKPGTYRRQRDKVTGKMRRGVYYTASAAGEPPAVRTGAFRASFRQKAWSERLTNGTVYHSATKSRLKAGNYVLGEILEGGTRKMAPRPYMQRTIDLAMPKVVRIYKERYIK